MTLFKRLRVAFATTVLFTMVLGVICIVLSYYPGDIFFSLLYFVPAFGVAYFFAPQIEERFPLKPSFVAFAMVAIVIVVLGLGGFLGVI